MTLPPPIDIGEVAQLEEARHARAVSAIAECAETIAGGTMCFGGPGSHANQAIGLGMNGPVSDADFDRLIDFYESRGFEPRLDVCPFAHESLVQGLAARKFVVKEFETVLVRRMDLPVAPLAPEIQIITVDPADGQQVAQLVAVVCAGFGVADSEVFVRMVHKSLRYPNTFAYIASIDRTPAAAGSCEVTPPMGSLFGMATLEQFRKRGLQQALMIVRLNAARDAKCKYVTIGSKPHSATGRNAMRLGFQVAYTKGVLIRPGPGLQASL